MTITSVGIDLAKNVFAVHGVEKNGNTVLVKPRGALNLSPGCLDTYNRLRGLIGVRLENG